MEHQITSSSNCHRYLALIHRYIVRYCADEKATLDDSPMGSIVRIRRLLFGELDYCLVDLNQELLKNRISEKMWAVGFDAVVSVREKGLFGCFEEMAKFQVIMIRQKVVFRNDNK